jgi:photosystem II stability/assembly factor-like uncharacterized protein
MKKLLLILFGLITLQTQAQWSQLTSPALEGFSADDPAPIHIYNNYLFVGTPGGVYRSDLTGSSWTNMSNGIFHSYDSTLNVSHITSNTGGLYASTGYSIRKSVDNGATWTDASNGLLFLSPKRIFKLIEFKNKLYIFRENGTIHNMHESADSAKTWQTILYIFNLSGESVTSTPSKLYLVDEDTLRESTDGANFNPVVTNLPAEMQSLTGDDTYLYAIAGSFTPSIYRLDLSTNTWAQKTSGLPFGAFPALLQYVNDTLYSVSLNIITREVGIYMSVNHGDSWTKRNSNGLSFPAVSNMVPVNGTIFGSSVEGLYKTQDAGNTWTWASSNIRASFQETLIASGSTLYATNDRGLVRSADNGNSVTFASSGIPSRQTITGVFRTTGTLYATTQNLFGDTTFIYKSTDSATTWNLLTMPAGVTNPEIIGNHDARLYIKEGPNVYKTDNEGGAWTAVTNIGLTDVIQIGGTTTTSGSVTFAVGDLSTPDYLVESTDNGASWHAAISGLGPAINTPRLEVVENSAFLIMNDSVFKRSGPVWNQTLMSGLSLVTRITDIDYYRGRLYISTDTGVYFSNYLTGVWTPMSNSGIQNGIIPTRLAVSDDFVFLGTENGGIWKAANPFTGLPDIKADADKFNIYPNPASTFATISFETDQNSMVNIEVYDITGRNIMSVNPEMKQAGSHLSELNISSLKQGLYYVVLKSGGKTASAKLLVNR